MSYLGSKGASGAFQAIIALMPPHDTFIDLFSGSGLILKRKMPCVRSYSVDKDPTAPCSSIDMPRHTHFVGDARSFLDKFDYAGSGRTLIYADPPYLHSTRTSRNRYRHEMTDADHLDLLAQLRCVPAEVIISGYPSQLYDCNLPGFETKQFQVMTRGGPRTEKLWYNFEPSAVHWASFAGVDFTDRQRIKRKAARWAANFGSLSPGERLAILSAILSAETDTDGYAGQPGNTDDGVYGAGTIDAIAYRRRQLWSTSSMLQLPLMPESGVTKPGPARERGTERHA